MSGCSLPKAVCEPRSQCNFAAGSHQSHFNGRWTSGLQHDVAALFHVIDIDLIAFNERKVLTAENQEDGPSCREIAQAQAVSVSQASAGRQTSMFG